jgi:tetratricopeptide (TPR) repeat protein
MTRLLVASGLVVGLTLVSVPTEAQTGAVRGKVVDSEGQPLADAKVLIEGRGEMSRKYETRTNEKGEYTQVGVLRGPYRIAAFKEGYQAVAVEEMVHLGEPTEVPDLKLQALGRDSTVSEDAAGELRKNYAEAVELTRAGQFDEAEALYKEILKVMPGLGPVHQNLGYISAERGDWARAEERYLEALELTPDEPAIKHGLIRVYQASDQDDKAFEIVRQLAEDNPGDGAAQFNRALFLNDAGRQDEAEEAFEAALAADPGLAEAHYELGRIMLLQSKGPEAVEHLEAYLAGDPGNEQHVATAQGLLEALTQAAAP